MHTRHCPRHVFAAPPAHFSGVNVMRGRVARGLYAAERTRGMAEEAGRAREHGRVSRREKDRCGRGGSGTKIEKEKGRGRERTSSRGMEIILRKYLGWGKTYCQRTKHLPQKVPPPPLFTSHPPCTIGLVGPRTSTSRIDSLTDGADVPSFPRETGNSANSRR